MLVLMLVIFLCLCFYAGAGARVLMCSVQHLQGMAAHGAQGVDGAGHPLRGVPGAQVLLVVRKGLDRKVGRGRGCRRRRFRVRFPGA